MATEPLTKEPRWKITPSETPAPPWTGKVFFCERCLAWHKLEASDVCQLARLPESDVFLTPTCTCGHRTRIRFADSALGLLKLGLEADPPPPGSGAAGEPIEEDWNAS